MIALDTNVLVRFIVQDDPGQAAAAMSLLGKEGRTFFLSHLVLAEMVWTLRRIYGFSRDQLQTVVRDLLDRRDLVFEGEATVRAALRSLADGGDFADALIVAAARERGCESFVTFDGDLVRRHPDFVQKPR